MTIHRKTYACRCGKKNPIPADNTTFKCGCGRSATSTGGKVIVTDKPKGKTK